MNDPDLPDLLQYLSSGLDRPAQWRGWRLEPVAGGANNLLFRARGERADYAVKFTIRDERQRASREYNTLQALHQAGWPLAPDPVSLDQTSYPQPVVVQSWLPGAMVEGPPDTDRAWSQWLQYIAKVHAFSPDHTAVDLQPCLSNANGSAGYYREVDSLRERARAAKLPAAVVAYADRLAQLPLGDWPPAPPRLCRADHNVRNFIRRGGSLKSVDWEYSGWGDPAEDLAELISHATYMRVPPERWPLVIDEYADLSASDDIKERIQLCLAIKLVGWLVRVAQAMVAPGSVPAKLTKLKGEWRVDTQEKYDYYLQRTQSQFAHFSVA